MSVFRNIYDGNIYIDRTYYLNNNGVFTSVSRQSNTDIESSNNESRFHFLLHSLDVMLSELDEYTHQREPINLETCYKLKETNEEQNLDQTICSICLEEDKPELVKINCCSGIFCKSCINPWLQEKRTCPCCRFKY